MKVGKTMKKLINHFNAITKNTKARPILSHVNFNSETQSIECTDSHRLLQVKPNEPIEQTFNLNLTTLETTNTPYPDLSSLIVPSGENVFDLTLKSLSKEDIKLFKLYKKDLIHLFIENEHLVFKVDNSEYNLFNLPLTGTEIPMDFSMYFNPLYLFDCFNFLIETEKEIITVYYNGNIRPLQLSRENEFNYLITPLRKY